jgi:hypothetical protein
MLTAIESIVNVCQRSAELRSNLQPEAGMMTEARAVWKGIGSIVDKGHISRE